MATTTVPGQAARQEAIALAIIMIATRLCLSRGADEVSWLRG
jgi:hypothetical protein